MTHFLCACPQFDDARTRAGHMFSEGVSAALEEHMPEQWACQWETPFLHSGLPFPDEVTQSLETPDGLAENRTAATVAVIECALQMDNDADAVEGKAKAKEANAGPTVERPTPLHDCWVEDLAGREAMARQPHRAGHPGLQAQEDNPKVCGSSTECVRKHDQRAYGSGLALGSDGKVEFLYTATCGNGDAGRRRAWRGREGLQWTDWVGGEQQGRLPNLTESRTTDKGGGLEALDRAPTAGASGPQVVGRTWEPSQ
eukprot:3489663-Rhodomonas_salina.1